MSCQANYLFTQYISNQCFINDAIEACLNTLLIHWFYNLIGNNERAYFNIRCCSDHDIWLQGSPVLIYFALIKLPHRCLILMLAWNSFILHLHVPYLVFLHHFSWWNVQQFSRRFPIPVINKQTLIQAPTYTIVYLSHFFVL